MGPGADWSLFLDYLETGHRMSVRFYLYAIFNSNYNGKKMKNCRYG